jgi:hypothetical protein
MGPQPAAQQCGGLFCDIDINARTWYQKAAAAARTPEFGAACTLMACRCDYQARAARAGRTARAA